MNSRVPLFTVALSLCLLAGAIVWVGYHAHRPAASPPSGIAGHKPPSPDPRHEPATPTQANAGAPAVAQTKPAARAAHTPKDGVSARQSAFEPPRRDSLGDDQFAKLVREGEQIFTNTQTHANQYVGNKLQCSNCHLDAGRKADSAPLWAAWPMYPKYRGKNKHVNDYAERLQGCFKYSMKGTPPPRGSHVLVALEAYSYWLATGAPTGKKLPGAGYPKLDKPAEVPDYRRGKQAFAQHCALCHGDNGQGQQSANGVMAFPALWGPNSYNWGAGMHRVNTAAAFIKANMPLGAPNLTAQQAWDVAQFVDSHERPQDPRFTGSVAETRKKYHDTPYSAYGTRVAGQLLGQKAPPAGTRPAGASTSKAQ